MHATNWEFLGYCASRHCHQKARGGGHGARQHEFMRVRGAREHNLKNVDLDIPATRWWCSRAYRDRGVAARVRHAVGRGAVVLPGARAPCEAWLVRGRAGTFRTVERIGRCEPDTRIAALPAWLNPLSTAHTRGFRTGSSPASRPRRWRHHGSSG